MGDDARHPVEPSGGRFTDIALATPDALAAQDDDAESTVDEARYDYPHALPADADDRDHPNGSEPEEPAPVSAGTQVVQDAPAPTPAQLRIDFGAHLEANYRRLVAQLYAITFDPAEAHSAVQDAYSRAWRTWATVSRSPDSVGWVRRVAVRSTIRSWRRLRLRSRRTVGPPPRRRRAPCSRRCAACPPPSGGAWCCTTWPGRRSRRSPPSRVSRWAPRRRGSRGRRRS